ncbi:hypothetical protein BKA70DRAFT_1501829 [Coprinopsis sp. MPI-PUGE-AT-0042]|nr:hypothetical protein BKA70DRAFT_1501829 [Coprinopsis sp. MPI-PUGE-AT-0042]
MKPTQADYKPSHLDFLVQFSPGEFTSGLITTRSWKAGDRMTPLTGLTQGPKRYSSVQCGKGPNDHVELNSDLVYVNHSCEPNIAFDLSSPDPQQWHLHALQDIAAGEPLVFFYPSTEWEMDQPFSCQCGAATCLGSIQGARYLEEKDLVSRGFVAPYILELVS